MIYYKDLGKTVRVSFTEKGEYLVTRKRRVATGVCRQISVVDPDDYCKNLDYEIENFGIATIDHDDIVPGCLYVLGNKNSITSILSSCIYRAVKEVTWANNRHSIVFEKVMDDTEDIPGVPIANHLSESDCNFLGVKFAPGLIIMPTEMGWKRVNENYHGGITSNDLSTYPESRIKGCTNSIRYMMIRLGGFKSESDFNIIETPEGTSIDLTLFMVSLKVKVAEEIVSLAGYTGFNLEEDIPFTVVRNDYGKSIRQSNHHIVDNNGYITLILDLTKNGKGVSVSSMKGKNVESLFRITWDETFSVRTKDGFSVITEGSKETSKYCPDYPTNIFYKRNNRFWRRVINGHITGGW